MQTTAAVINAGLGDLTFGLEAAGFKVVAAYETDEKAIKVHMENMGAPVYLVPPEKIDIERFPKIDLLAARIYLPPFSRAVHDRFVSSDPFLRNLQEILAYCRPSAFLVLTNASSAKNGRLQSFLKEIAKVGYQFVLQAIDIAQAVGFPVNERQICVVGTLRSTGKLFRFSDYSFPAQMPPEIYLQLDQPVDPWYFRVKLHDILQYEDGKRFYCWKNRAYVGADHVQWNYMKVPLVRTSDGLRKITHREIANLKGFPANYALPDNMDKQWLYQKLMYAGNVLVVKQIAGMINYILTDNPWRSQQAERGMRFESLFDRYLTSLADKGDIEREPRIEDEVVDFAFHQGDINLYFEIKYYNSSFALTSKVRTACKRLSPFKADGVPILVVANEVPDDVKSQCWEQFHVSIWDVGNLLWLFDELADIKNEFIASLDYSIEHIEPKPPTPDVFRKAPEGRKEGPSWKEKLLHIVPGREQFQAYESACIEILKYVLGDYLTLWEAQEPANDGLYRFDLCCKIKNGANQDFFDTIKHYFNTKYIVFEFKNYSKKITQKEIYTTEKYLYEKALRKVAIIISRSGADEHALQAARGSLRETGKLILCLSDNALLEMIDIKERGEQEPAEFLGVLLDDLLVHLEK